jgi:hypothetical protein
MKKVIITAALLTATALTQAGTSYSNVAALVASNEIGGKIFVTELACSNGQRGDYAVITDRYTHIQESGCSWVSGNSIVVRWNDGDVRYYNRALFFYDPATSLNFNS